jgi:hypothetical protein
MTDTKIPIVNREEYILYLEFFSNLYWLHTDVFKWSASIKKKYIRDLDILQYLLNAPLYGLVDNEKLGKFGETLGFKFIKPLLGKDGNTYKIYTRS